MAHEEEVTSLNLSLISSWGQQSLKIKIKVQLIKVNRLNKQYEPLRFELNLAMHITN